MAKLAAVPMTIEEANRFVVSFHRHSKAVLSARFAVGVTDGESLRGVAIVGRPVARMLQDGLTAEVNRCCVEPDAPKGCCSFLYASCWRAWRSMGGRKLITYTLKSESGASLRGAGWDIVGETKAHPWHREARAREWQPIYGQQKLRWEIAC